VFDLGGLQTTFHIRGPFLENYLADCEQFYHNCEKVTWPQLYETLKSYLPQWDGQFPLRVKPPPRR
jgi:hypothetical protein